MATKKILSYVLSDINIKWHKITEDDSQIPVNIPLVVRIFNPDIVIEENDDQVVFAEERRIAIYTDDKKWNVSQPFPKYNLSSLVEDDGSLKEHSIVSHWDLALPEEIEKYTTRLNNIINWKYLDIKCDPSEEKSIYKALIFMQDIIREHYALTSSFGAPDENNKTMTELSIGLLHDLVSIIDMGHHIENEKSAIEEMESKEENSEEPEETIENKELELNE